MNDPSQAAANFPIVLHHDPHLERSILHNLNLEAIVQVWLISSFV